MQIRMIIKNNPKCMNYGNILFGHSCLKHSVLKVDLEIIISQENETTKKMILVLFEI